MHSCLRAFSIPAPLCLPGPCSRKVIQTMQGRGDRLTYRSVNVMSPEEAAAKSLPSVYILPGTDGAGDLVSECVCVCVRGGGG